MIKKSTMLIALLAVFIWNANAQQIKKYESLLTKHNAKYSREIKGPLEDKFPVPTATKSNTVMGLPQIEEIDEWNYNNSEWDTIQHLTHEYNAKGLVTLTTLSYTVLGPGLQFEYLYNDLDKVRELTIKFYDKNNSTWTNWMRYKYTCNEKGFLTGKLDQTWNTSTAEWINGINEDTHYDEYDNITYYTKFVFDNGGWLGLEGVQRDYVYDAQGRKILDMSILMNPTFSRWDTVDRMHYSYSSTGNLTESIYQMYNGGNWENSMKEVTTIDDKEEASENITLYYNRTSGTWDSLQRMHNIKWFDWNGSIANSDPKEYTIQAMEQNGFENSYRFFAERPDPYGTKIETTEIYNGSVFVPQNRITNRYDHFGFHREYMFEEYENGAFELSALNKTDITYNNLTILEKVHSEWEPGLQELVNTTRYRYSDFLATGINKSRYNSQVMNIYPNPSKDKSNISVDVIAETNLLIEVYNLTGQKIITVLNDEKLGTGKHQFSFSAPAGIYIVRTQMNNEIYTAKAIVE